MLVGIIYSAFSYRKQTRESHCPRDGEALEAGLSQHGMEKHGKTWNNLMHTWCSSIVFHLLMVSWSLCVSLYRSFFSAPQFSSESPWLCGHLGGSLLSKVLLHLRASLQVTPCFFYPFLLTPHLKRIFSTRSGNPASPNAASRKGIVSGTKTRPPTSPHFNSISDHALKTRPVDTRAAKEHLVSEIFWHEQSCRMCCIKFRPASSFNHFHL